MPSQPLSHARQKAVDALAAIPSNSLSKLTLFENAYVLDILPCTAELAGIRHRLAQQLAARLQPSGITHGQLSEIFAALTALWRYDPALLSGEYLALAVRRLIACELKTGGPYRDTANLALDANLYIARFMQLAAKPLPGVQAFLRSKIRNHDFTASRISQPYLLQLLHQIFSQGPGEYAAAKRARPEWQSPVCQGVIYHILHSRKTNGDSSKLLHAICKQQRPDGFWYDASLLHSGSSANSHITATASILAALPAPKPAAALTRTLQQKHHAIVCQARQAFSAHTEPLRSLALSTVEQVCAADKNFEITLLPYFFADAVGKRPPFTRQQHTALSLATVCGWVAYTLYDDIIDRETTPTNLPIANVAMRNSLHYFGQAMPGQPSLHTYVLDTFAAMDEANMWEITHCRFDIKNGVIFITRLPAYRKGAILAERAFAHALAPMAILARCGLRKKAFRHVESAFRHYLIARQLNDDMHDWQKDVTMGQSSYVVTAILRNMRVKPGQYPLPQLITIMQRHFARTVFIMICHRILYHLGRARYHFSKSRALRPGNRIYALLDKLEHSVRAALATHAQAESFCSVGNRLGW